MAAATDQTQSDLLLTAIKTTQELRGSVAQVFERLKNGISETDSLEDKEKTYLSEIQHKLLAVNNDLT